MRTWWRQTGGWWLVAAAALIAAVIPVVLRAWLPQAVATSVVAFVVAVTAVVAGRGRRIVQRREDHRHSLPDQVWMDERGHVPWVRDITDAIAIGVHPAAHADSLAGSANGPTAHHQPAHHRQPA